MLPLFAFSLSLSCMSQQSRRWEEYATTDHNTEWKRSWQLCIWFWPCAPASLFLSLHILLHKRRMDCGCQRWLLSWTVSDWETVGHWKRVWVFIFMCAVYSLLVYKYLCVHFFHCWYMYTSHSNSKTTGSVGCARFAVVSIFQNWTVEKWKKVVWLNLSQFVTMLLLNAPAKQWCRPITPPHCKGIP